MEKDSLKEATCELIRETKITNQYLRELVALKSSKENAGGYHQFQKDEAAFMAYWLTVPFRDGLDLALAQRTWDAALRWERGKK